MPASDVEVLLQQFLLVAFSVVLFLQVGFSVVLYGCEQESNPSPHGERVYGCTFVAKNMQSIACSTLFAKWCIFICDKAFSVSLF